MDNYHLYNIYKESILLDVLIQDLLKRDKKFKKVHDDLFEDLRKIQNEKEIKSGYKV